jgi:thiol:disulfide interchange protein DsbD
MKRFLKLLAALMVVVAAARADEITARATIVPDKLTAGTRFQIEVALDLPAPWHANANPPSDKSLIPTTLTWNVPASVVIERVTYPAGKAVKLEWADKPVSLYEGRVVIVTEGRVREDAAGGALKIEGKLRYQACDNETCQPPKSLPVRVEAMVTGTAKLKGTEDATERVPPGEENQVASLVRQYGLLPALFFVFLGGLALNLTPCVYPMITITVSYFGGTGGGERSVGKAFASSLVYCLGIVVTYSTLGLLAAVTGSLFGALLQSPVVLLVIAALLVALALSMFGLYEIQPPRFLLERAMGLSSKAGYVGVFFLGAMIGIIAAPCLAPFVVALLTFVAQRADPWLGWWLFFVFACGLGLPYVVLGTFSGLLSRLPKSGTWMVWVKRVMGVLLIGVAAWITNPLWAKHETADPLKIPAQLAAAKAAGKPVILDFFATWCVPCKEMEKLVMPDPRVQERLRKFEFVKVDVSSSDSPVVNRLAEQYEVRGVPTYVFLDVAGNERKDLRTVGFTPTDEFAKRLDRALAPASTNAPVSSSSMPAMPAELMKPF